MRDTTNPITKKKVLLIATVDVHFKAFHLPTMAWLQRQGIEVHVAAKGDLALPHCDKRFHIPFCRSPYKAGNLQAYQELKLVIDSNDYSFIHCHTPVGGLLGRLAARDAREKGSHVLYTSHGFPFYKGAPLLNRLLYYPVERFLARFTDTLITINEEDFTLATQRHFPAKQIEKIPGFGVDTGRFVPVNAEKRATQRQDMGYNDEDILLVYAAEFNRNKNQELLIQALASTNNPKLRLLLAGKGPMQEACQILANKLGVAEQVEFLGYRDDIDKLLPLCDIAVSSSRHEGLPVNVMEAMSCGLPVIGTSNRGHCELVVDGKTGRLIPPEDHHAMGEALNQLANDPQARRSMGNNGRRRIRQHYDLPIATKAMTAIYSQFLEKGP